MRGVVNFPMRGVARDIPNRGGGRRRMEHARTDWYVLRGRIVYIPLGMCEVD